MSNHRRTTGHASRLMENVAAISYRMGSCWEHGSANTFYERHEAELEGEIGVLRYFIVCAEEMTVAEETAEFDLRSAWDWYEAVDGFCHALTSAKELPDRDDLVAMAFASIVEAASASGKKD